jgi:hypothetical protein
MIAWVYGSGFPKSLDVGKAISKRAGGDVVARKAIGFMRARREELGLSRIEFERLIFGRSDGNVRNWEDGISLPKPGLWADIKLAMALDVTPFDADMERGDEEVGRNVGSFGYQKGGERWESERVLRAPATEAARQWQGWGTALKPALEPITVARKPLVGTVAANVRAQGTGALNIDGCRVAVDVNADASQLRTMQRSQRDGADGWGMSTVSGDTPQVVRADGRWPANLIHDGSEDVLAWFTQSKGTASGGSPDRNSKSSEAYWGEGGGGFKGGRSTVAHGDNGSAARFFYCAKASKADRDEGLDHMAKDVVRVTNTGHTGNPSARNGERTFNPRANNHPTVKPTALMRYLCRLVTPQSGTVLDPFMGSGSTGKAAVLEGFEFIGIEREAEYVAIAEARIVEAQRSLGLFA